MPSCVCLAYQRLTCTHTPSLYAYICLSLASTPTQMHLHLSQIVHCVGIPCTFSVFSSKRSNRARKKSRNTCGMWACVGVCVCVTKVVVLKEKTALRNTRIPHILDTQSAQCTFVRVSKANRFNQNKAMKSFGRFFRQLKIQEKFP